MTVRLYGIPYCDSVKRARRWLDTRGIDYAFHDYKKDGADPAKLARWIEVKGIDAVLNRRGTTWRKMPDEDKARADGNDAVSMLVQHPSMIKRPIVEYDGGHAGGILVGFKEDEWDTALT